MTESCDSDLSSIRKGNNVSAKQEEEDEEDKEDGCLVHGKRKFLDENR